MLGVGFTGTQRGITDAQLLSLDNVFDLVDALGGDLIGFHHGDCIGADASAHFLASERGWTTCSHPMTPDHKRAYTVNDCENEPKPPLERNEDIVREAYILVACPKGFVEERRSGTWATVRYMRKKILGWIFIIFPDGMIKIERPKG